ncbi:MULTISPECIES: hypothetical protein [Bradyrhizobium]|jgi:hypothetical protein|uniref:Uncharacterized protein n=1 Tax=Bradyrhizobium elkanii TaxID=29448 RepID=A0A8I2C6N1_BRAEL|nr:MULTISPECIES: hypothetical protein [Bradyrhizobium]MBP1297099.1 hypothetical protein [Bradyrhizobium elkanii]MCP1932139.1 hypothetical protein [Bradyrhizobium elkanii]MCS3577319.1 hypothetical protein [Bradyrhizobium elkanii]MCS3720195.1 hypothetical protein [Bradyrhizobium elkanii]MCS3881145.1 hypothetical protein [Bradyrhizobium elkanii]
MRKILVAVALMLAVIGGTAGVIIHSQPAIAGGGHDPGGGGK